MTQGAPAPVDAASTGETHTGLSPRAAAVLAYVAWWISGGLLLLAEPEQPFVRFHARQALIVFGLLWIIGVVLWASSFLAVLVSPLGFRVLALAGQAVWAIGLVLWATCLVQAWRGRRWGVPGFGRFVAR